jgi:starch synthase (maltosyl-transferring)
MQDGRIRVVIEKVHPEVDGGRFPIKRTSGQTVVVEADIFTDGHDVVAAEVLHRPAGSSGWLQSPMQALDNDRWRGEFPVGAAGQHVYTVEGWVDHFLSWRRDMLKRIAAQQDSDIDYLSGAALVEDAIGRARDPDAQWLRSASESLRRPMPIEAKRELALGADLQATMGRYPDRRFAKRYDHELLVVVDPDKARFSAWYEFFPRSATADTYNHGTFKDAESMLPYVARMGFDVVYLPPIHPVGRKFRKGKNNAVTAAEGEPGSPWAIGSSEGGHKGVHPELGTLEDFDRFVAKASALGLDVALDIAFQAAPDHPYVVSHPEWFRKRPDGTIQYAENPPKKYQDIYPFDFESDNWKELWQELKSVFLFWVGHGIRIFRVDNPHTKAFPFWEWVIAEVKKTHPEVLFLSEAFTRPKVMYRLAKLGFSQSYTYFPWRHTKQEITDYLKELTQTDVREFFRPNQWPNTPDILTEFLQTSGRPGFMMRLVLAATLGANYGIYGPAFELLDSTPRQPGSEEYLDSEKYQIRKWDLAHPESLHEFIGLVNRIRRSNTALQNDWGLRFHQISNEQLICYSKRSDDGSNLVLVVVNLDPHHAHSGYVEFSAADLPVDTSRPYQLHELLTGARYVWKGPRNYVELDPKIVPAQIFAVRKPLRTEKDFEYFL